MNRYYDKELIDNRIRVFQGQHYNHREVTLYFDMDNTLCLFSPYGNVAESMQQAYTQGFYRKLPCFPEVPATLKTLKKLGYRVKILSSCVDSPYCRIEKKAWVNYHLPFIPDKDILLLPMGQAKSTLIPSPTSSILVDDYCNNLMDIYIAGGIGVKKTFSGKTRPIPQVQTLTDIFIVLDYLNCL